MQDRIELRANQGKWIVIMGDFNMRIAEVVGGKRGSKNKGGKVLVHWVELRDSLTEHLCHQGIGHGCLRRRKVLWITSWWGYLYRPSPACKPLPICHSCFNLLNSCFLKFTIPLNSISPFDVLLATPPPPNQSPWRLKSPNTLLPNSLHFVPIL